MLTKTREVLPSAYNMITSSRSIGYTMESAVADIIDNSISAGATKIDILTPPVSNKIVCLTCDNGIGMDLLELDHAMTFGGRDYIAQRESSDLGRYGLGLKTASLSQCRKFSVITKKKGSNLIGGFWDLDLVEQHNEWKYEVIPSDVCIDLVGSTPLAEYDSGTVVIWENFDGMDASSSENMRKQFSSELFVTQDHLELVFHRYLVGEIGIKKIDISINGNLLIANDPFLISRSPGVVEPINVEVDKNSIQIIAHKLVHPSKLSREEMKRLQIKGTLLNTQGFYIYRNKRLLIWGTWFGMAHRTDRTKLARIQIDIPNTLDHLWSIDIKKSQARPPEFLKPQLRNILDTVADLSVRTYKGRVRTPKERAPFWNRTLLEEKYVKYEISRKNPLIEFFEEQLDESQNKLFLEILRGLEVFLPVSQLHLDLQSDTSIKNESESEDSIFEVLENKFETYLSYGIPKETILLMEPFCYNREFVEKKRI